MSQWFFLIIIDFFQYILSPSGNSKPEKYFAPIISAIIFMSSSENFPVYNLWEIVPCVTPNFLAISSWLILALLIARLIFSCVFISMFIPPTFQVIPL